MKRAGLRWARTSADVRREVRKLAAAGLDFQVARAGFSPSLDINAGIGQQALTPRDLFITPEALFYDVGRDLVMPVINRKAIQAAFPTCGCSRPSSVEVR